MISPFGVPAVAVPVLIVVFVLARAYRDVDDSYVAEWAQAHALQLTPHNEPMVHWYLRNARVLRTWGVLAGLFLPPLIAAALGIRVEELPGNVAWAFVGYLVGALYAELALVRPTGSYGRRAVLAPRDLQSYLPRRLTVGPMWFGAVIAGVAAATLTLPYNRDGGVFRPSGVGLLLVGALAVAVPLLCLGLQRWLIRRPQPFADAELLAADDAIRSQSAHSIAGSCLAIQTLLASWACWQLATSDVQIFRWTMLLPAILGWVFAVYACLYYGHRAWRVRRTFTVRTLPTS